MTNPSDTIAVYLARHLQQVQTPGPIDWYPEADLAPESAPVAERIRAAHLQSLAFDFVGCSPVKRAVQSALALVPGLSRIETMRTLGPCDGEDWTFLQRISSATAADCYKEAPDLLEKKGRQAFFAIRDLVRRLSAGNTAFLVSHGPIVEMTIGWLLGQHEPVPDMGKGEIALLKFDLSSQLVDCKRLPVPPE